VRLQKVTMAEDVPLRPIENMREKSRNAALETLKSPMKITTRIPSEARWAQTSQERPFENLDSRVAKSTCMR
jgi:hypothetical protein